MRRIFSSNVLKEISRVETRKSEVKKHRLVGEYLSFM